MPSIRSLLTYGYNELKHIDTASLDTEVLLSFVLGKPKEYLLAHQEDEVPDDKAEQFNQLVAERTKHKPIAYLIKQKEFYGRNFYVDERAHVPRPATEDLIDYIKEFVPLDFSGAMADIGTGSGCIAVTLALEFLNAKIIATDISMEALVVAKINADKCDKISFYQGDLFSALPHAVDIIVSNPPYGWGDGWSNDPEVGHQPKISYDGGPDGLDIIKRLLKQLPDYLTESGQAFIKFDPRRKNEIVRLLTDSPFSWQIKKDRAGWDRIVRLTHY